MLKYRIDDIYHLEECTNVPGKFIGSAGCTASCEFCSDYKTDDYHDRIDVIKFTCNFEIKKEE